MKPNYKNLNNNKAIALICIIIFTFVLTIIGASLLSLLANQTRTIEHNIDRLRALYAVESIFVRQIDNLTRSKLNPDVPGGELANTESFPWVSGTKLLDVRHNYNAATNTTGFNITLDYPPGF